MDLEIGKCSFTKIARGVPRVLVPGICMVETESGEAGLVSRQGRDRQPSRLPFSSPFYTQAQGPTGKEYLINNRDD